VSAERDELVRLVQELPEDHVPQALAVVRRLSRPAFMAAASGDGRSIAEDVDELLRDGFGG
jgi:hypothetical protein